MTVEASPPASRVDIVRALREAAFAALIAFGLFLPLIGFNTVQNIRNELVLETRWPLLAALVAIIAVTDENDYSFVDGGLGWVAAAKTRSDPIFHGGASVCKSNPNDRCCNNCGEGDLPGCTPHAQDPACAQPLDDNTDPTNLRASRSKEQYGIDFDWPIDRYVEGFTRPDAPGGTSSGNLPSRALPHGEALFARTGRRHEVEFKSVVP